jgi:hypothetical protein
VATIAGQQAGTWADRLRRGYFPLASALLLILTLIGFSDNLVTNVGQRSNGDPKFIVHGLFCLAWIVMLTVQANLVRRGNVRLHRTLGLAGMGIAIGVTLSTLYVFVAVWKGWDAMGIIGRANRLFLPGYALLVLLAYRNRRRPDWHKRLIFVASLYMLEPVLSRSLDPFIDYTPLVAGWSESDVDRFWWYYFVLVWNALFLSLFAYDYVVSRRIHAVTAMGYAGFCAVWIVVRVS